MPVSEMSGAATAPSAAVPRKSRREIPIGCSFGEAITNPRSGGGPPNGGGAAPGVRKHKCPATFRASYVPDLQGWKAASALVPSGYGQAYRRGLRSCGGRGDCPRAQFARRIG